MIAPLSLVELSLVTAALGLAAVVVTILLKLADSRRVGFQLPITALVLLGMIVMGVWIGFR
ncbi:hypothetical protein [Verrucomicrobium sp. BvORR106]|uniref:hypothetical protein n=1 Tax=Verrucomicrobium sp. BvORR106 TaxID=1403819 RepID=UPI00056DBD97|nr:hypothetical protein [Verrucomicrobium sp. BvORR106]